MAKIFFSPAAEKDLRKLSGPAQNEAGICLVNIGANPYSGKPLHGPLRGFFVYRFSAEGEACRIAYEIIAGNIVVLMIGNRNNFYKKFSRRVK